MSQSAFRPEERAPVSLRATARSEVSLSNSKNEGTESSRELHYIKGVLWGLNRITAASCGYIRQLFFDQTGPLSISVNPAAPCVKKKWEKSLHFAFLASAHGVWKCLNTHRVGVSPNLKSSINGCSAQRGTKPVSILSKAYLFAQRICLRETSFIYFLNLCSSLLEVCWARSWRSFWSRRRGRGG